jgi:outer membrane protein assembly factor BamB
MTQTITFTPGARSGVENEDLHYFERSSRGRSVHALFQDCGPQKSPSRRQFLLKSYRELVSRFGSVGRIEHPLPFLRRFALVIDRLSTRVDCRVDDFRGIGLYVLIQHGSSFYLLASRAGHVLMETEGAAAFVPLADLEVASELQLDTAAAQQELFSQSLKDYLGLYRIEPPPSAVIVEGDGSTTGVAPFGRFAMGGSAQEIDSALETLGEPGAVTPAAPDTEVEHPLISNKIVVVAFPPPVPTRDPVRDALRAGATRKRNGLLRVAAPAAAVVVVTTMAAVWLTERLDSDDGDEVSVTNPARVEGTQESSPRLIPRVEESREVDAGIAPPDSGPAAAEPAREIGLAVAWRATYDRAVTTSPVVDGGKVIFGSRDGNVYALDQRSGETAWSYEAREGVGASPVVVGGAVVGADYRGNVFCLEKKTGRVLWTRGLPAKVVSTPCVAGGEVLIGCTDGVGYCLSLETGRVLWRVKTGARIRGSAASANGRFYLPSYDGKVYALTQGSGAIRWEHEIGGPIASTPAADARRVVVGGEGGVYAIDAEAGRRLWRVRTAAPVRSFVLLAEGCAYAGCNDGRLYCLDAATGEEIWKARTGEAVLSRPRLADEMIFVTSYDKSVYCLNAETGQMIDRFETSGPIFSSPAIDGDQVFFGNNEGEFYCINYRMTSSQ